MRKIAVLLLCLLAGCSSNKLDQSTGEGLVKQYLTDGSGRIQMNVGRVGTQCPYLDDKGKQAPIPLDLSPSLFFPDTLAEKAGLITVTTDGPGFWRVALTEEGKKAMDADRARFLKGDALNGCDFQTVFLVLGSAELVKVNSITPRENAALITYTWKWNTTPLGRDLRQDGRLYSLLTPSEREQLQRSIHSGVHKLQLPLPPEDHTEIGSVTVRKDQNGWRPEFPPVI